MCDVQKGGETFVILFISGNPLFSRYIAPLNVAFAGVSHKGSGKAQGIQLGAVLPLPSGEPEARARTLNNPGYIGKRLDGAVSADHVYGLTLIL